MQIHAEYPDDPHGKYKRTNFIPRQMIGGFFNAVRDLADMTGADSALEVGCGEGFSTQRLRAMLPPAVPVEASDVDDCAVTAAAAANPGVPVTRESIYDMRRANASYDLLFVLEVLEHLADPRRAMDEVLRVARRWVILSVPREPLWRVMNLARLKYVRLLGNTPGHIGHWSRGSFARFVGNAADVRKIRTPWPWTVVLARKRGT